MISKILKILLVGVGLIVGFIFIFPLFLPSEYSVQQEKFINGNIEHTYNQIIYLDSLKKWNLLFDADLKYVEDNQVQKIKTKYPWRAKSFGSGQIKIDSIVYPQLIFATVYIEQPFESLIHIKWELNASDSKVTNVKWSAHGDLSYPFGRMLAGQTSTFMNTKMQKSLNKLEERNQP